MSAPKLTEWFPADVRPARRGMYEVDDLGEVWPAYWDGLIWWYGEKQWELSCQDREWRGLAEQPKEQS